MVTENTRNLEEFGYREISMARELLGAWVDQGLPDDFEYDGVNIEFNPNSGCVFLVNSEFQVAMMNGDKLESWYTLPYSGEEGFKEDFQDRDRDEFQEDDLEYLIDIGVFEAKEED